jgi:F-type H+-transporting ATPase subunit epsilon
MDKLLLEIVSADKSFLKKEVDAVRAPGVKGDFGILPGHAPMIACIDIGVLRYRLNDKMIKVAVGGGFLEIFENKVSVLVDTAESREDIDVARAKKAKEKAAGKLRKNLSDDEHLKMEAALRKALARINVAE